MTKIQTNKKKEDRRYSTLQSFKHEAEGKNGEHFNRKIGLIST